MSQIEWKFSQHYTAYEDALKFMEERVEAIDKGEAGECIWMLEHPPLYTSGTSADIADLVEPDRFPVYDAGRGGQYTYHGPGQRVVYFMLDLKKRGRDLRKFIHNLEEVIIQTLASFDINGERREDRIGVWVARGDGREDKVAAIGVRVRRWISFHGIAINIEPDLSHFTGIVPCGIVEHGVTSIKDLGKNVTMAEVDAVIRTKFEQVFEG